MKVTNMVYFNILAGVILFSTANGEEEINVQLIEIKKKEKRFKSF